MTSFEDLKEFFATQKFDRVIIAAEGQTRSSRVYKNKVSSYVPPGGVGVAFDPIAKASEAIYIGRGRSKEDRVGLDKSGKMQIQDPNGSYTLKRIFLPDEIVDPYYYGFSNQTLWPLCHVAFEQPEFQTHWYEGYRRANEEFARAIQEEIRGKTFVWINDYQLSLVPAFLGKQKNVVVGMFWHIPWPTWEVFRILPQKKEILESLLQTDFLAFHRGYHARNFLETIGRELEARIDEETLRVYYNNHVTTVKNLPMGIDADVIKKMAQTTEEDVVSRLVKNLLGISDKQSQKAKKNALSGFFSRYKILLGVDRLDYTKGLVLRLRSLESFLEKNPSYRGKVVYLGIIAPSRENIPSYSNLKKQTRQYAESINKRFGTKDWKPIYLVFEVYNREEIMNFYKRAALCLVTPRDDGMNLVSKEFVLASSFSKNPGMLVLSLFAGSAIDLTQSLIVNPYDIEEMAAAIKTGLEMSTKEKRERIKSMAETLEERNIYEWAKDFVKSAVAAAR